MRRGKTRTLGATMLPTGLSTIRLVALLGSSALYVLSLFLPALEFNDHAPVSGFTALMLGWWGVVTADFAWFANAAYFVAFFCCFLSDYRSAAVAASTAVPLALLSYGADSWYFNESRGTPIAKLGSAFYVWLASIVWLVIASSYLTILRNRFREATATSRADGHGA
jgi:hypothetical protein